MKIYVLYYHGVAFHESKCSTKLIKYSESLEDLQNYMKNNNYQHKYTIDSVDKLTDEEIEKSKIIELKYELDKKMKEIEKIKQTKN